MSYRIQTPMGTLRLENARQIALLRAVLETLDGLGLFAEPPLPVSIRLGEISIEREPEAATRLEVVPAPVLTLTPPPAPAPGPAPGALEAPRPARDKGQLILAITNKAEALRLKRGVFEFLVKKHAGCDLLGVRPEGTSAALAMIQEEQLEKLYVALTGLTSPPRDPAPAAA